MSLAWRNNRVAHKKDCLQKLRSIVANSGRLVSRIRNTRAPGIFIYSNIYFKKKQQTCTWVLFHCLVDTLFGIRHEHAYPFMFWWYGYSIKPRKIETNQSLLRLKNKQGICFATDFFLFSKTISWRMTVPGAILNHSLKTLEGTRIKKKLRVAEDWKIGFLLAPGVWQSTFSIVLLTNARWH